MRIVTGAFSHESSTFTPVATTRSSFEDRFGKISANQIIPICRNANVPTGGFISGAEAHEFELIPTVFAEAHPSAPAPREVFDALLNEMLELMSAAGPVDGVLLQLHGAMVAEGISDADGHILRAVRQLVGTEVPIVAQLDIHSNVSPLMVEATDVLIGRETYPEIDMAERGRECADVLVRILNEGLNPTMALCQIPMMWGMNQVTAHPPMKQAIERLHEIESRPGVVCASIATCFPLADIPEMGASVHVVTNGNPDTAQSYADELGEWIFERRADWQLPTPSTREALTKADMMGSYPVIFADRNDNPGGGSPGDSTGVLRTFVEAGLKDACVLYIVDPEAISWCAAAGVGTSLTLDIGAKSSPLQGKPVRMTAEVVALSEGEFRYGGAMYSGLTGHMGPSAYIRQGGVHVILVSAREQPFDTAFPHTLGLHPEKMRYIGVKSAAHFRAGFESWAKQIFVVSESSVHSPEHIDYRHLGREVYPLQEPAFAPHSSRSLQAAGPSS